MSSQIKKRPGRTGTFNNWYPNKSLFVLLAFLSLLGFFLGDNLRLGGLFLFGSGFGSFLALHALFTFRGGSFLDYGGRYDFVYFFTPIA